MDEIGHSAKGEASHKQTVILPLAAAFGAVWLLLADVVTSLDTQCQKCLELESKSRLLPHQQLARQGAEKRRLTLTLMYSRGATHCQGLLDF